MIDTDYERRDESIIFIGKSGKKFLVSKGPDLPLSRYAERTLKIAKSTSFSAAEMVNVFKTFSSYFKG